jgi:hypothetical protein
MTLSRDQKISRFIAILTVGFICAAYFYYLRGLYRGDGFPDNTFLLPVVFDDFQSLIYGWHDSQFAGVGYGHVYYPGAYLIVAPFTALVYAHMMHGFERGVLVFETLLCGSLFLISWKYLKAKSLFDTASRAYICTFLTYPIMFAMVTANFEGMLFIFLALFIILYRSGRVALSLPFLGLSIAMKFMPAVFLLLLLADKRYRETAYAILWTAFFTLLPLLIFHGGLRDGLSPFLSNLRASQAMYFNLMVINRPGNHFGHSLLNSTRILLGQTAALSPQFLNGYMAFALACFAGIAFYVWKVEKVYWKQVTLLACCFCLLPYTSTDYKLLHFYMPAYLFLNAEESDGLDFLYVALFGLLMIPKSYFKFYHLDFYTSNGPINSFAMLALTMTIIVVGLRRRTFPLNGSATSAAFLDSGAP